MITTVLRSRDLDLGVLAAWRAGNDSGDGYAVGDDGDTPEQAAQREGLEVVEVDEVGRVLARSSRGRRVVICDANGPWAVAIGGGSQ